MKKINGKNLKDLETSETIQKFVFSEKKVENILNTIDEISHKNFDSIQENVVKNQNKHDNFFCLKQFSIKQKTETFDIEDLAKYENNGQDKEEKCGNDSKSCQQTCIEHLKCPEMNTELCEVFKNNQCECLIKCSIMEKKFKELNHIN